MWTSSTEVLLGSKQCWVAHGLTRGVGKIVVIRGSGRDKCVKSIKTKSPKPDETYTSYETLVFNCNVLAATRAR